MKKNIIIILAIVLAAILYVLLFLHTDKQYKKKMQQKAVASPVSPGGVEEAQVIRQLEAQEEFLSKYRVDVMARMKAI